MYGGVIIVLVENTEVDYVRDRSDFHSVINIVIVGEHDHVCLRNGTLKPHCDTILGRVWGWRVSVSSCRG